MIINNEHNHLKKSSKIQIIAKIPQSLNTDVCEYISEFWILTSDIACFDIGYLMKIHILKPLLQVAAYKQSITVQTTI